MLLLLSTFLLTLLSTQAWSGGPGMAPFFSAYIENGNDKAASIFNPSNASVDFYDLGVLIGRGISPEGSASAPPYQTMLFMGERGTSSLIGPGETFVVSSLTAQAAIQLAAELPNSGMLSNGVTFNGDDWLLLVTLTDGPGGPGGDPVPDQVLDVIGDTTKLASQSNPPYENVALERISTPHKKDNTWTYPNDELAATSGFVWNVSEWRSIDLETTDFAFLSTHYSSTFSCASHDQCPSSGFCSASGNCFPCAACVFDADGIGGECPSKCPSLCSGAVPLASTCPSCENPALPTFDSITEKPMLIEIPDDPTTLRLAFCAPIPFDFPSSAISLPSTTVEVTLSMLDPETKEAVDTVRVFSFVKEVSVEPLPSCPGGGGSAVTLDGLPPNQQLSATVVLAASCRTPPSPPTASFTTRPAPPSWLRSNFDAEPIRPSVAGSTSSLAVVQWAKPLVNCPSCDVLKSAPSKTFFYRTFKIAECTSRDFTVVGGGEGECSLDGGRTLKFGVKNGTVCVGAREDLVLPCEYVPIKSSAGTTVGVISVASCALCLGAMLFFLAFANRPIVKAGQPVFLCTFCFASAAFTGSMALQLGAYNRWTCPLSVWLPNLSFTLAFGTLVVKLWRVHVLFGGEQARKLQRVRITVASAAHVLAAVFMFNVGILAVWQWLDPPLNIEVDVTSNLQQYNGDAVYVSQCASSTAYGAMAVSVSHALLILAGLWFTYRTRNVSRKLAEKKEVLNVVYMTAVLATITGIVATPDAVPSDIKLVLASVTCGCGAATGCTAFLLPKLANLDAELTSEDLAGGDRRASKRGSVAGGARGSVAGGARGSAAGGARGSVAGVARGRGSTNFSAGGAGGGG
ncbi:hypothetical protein TeGR_g6053, partial [Tetraparma gracilis]